MNSHFNTVTNAFGSSYQWTHFCKKIKTRAHVLKCTTWICLENEEISGDFNWNIYDSDRRSCRSENLNKQQKMLATANSRSLSNSELILARANRISRNCEMNLAMRI